MSGSGIDALPETRRALSGCSAAAVAALEQLAGTESASEAERRWVVRAVSDGRYQRLRVLIPRWRTLATTGIGQSALRSLPEFSELVRAVSMESGLQTYFANRVSGPVVGWGPVAPAEIAEHLLRTALGVRPEPARLD